MFIMEFMRHSKLLKRYGFFNIQDTSKIEYVVKIESAKRFPADTDFIVKINNNSLCYKELDLNSFFFY